MASPAAFTNQALSSDARSKAAVGRVVIVQRRPATARSERTIRGSSPAAGTAPASAARRTGRPAASLAKTSAATRGVRVPPRPASNSWGSSEAYTHPVSRRASGSAERVSTGTIASSPGPRSRVWASVSGAVIAMSPVAAARSAVARRSASLPMSSPCTPGLASRGSTYATTKWSGLGPPLAMDAGSGCSSKPSAPPARAASAKASASP